ncbi:MAG: SurA N-terminal domain-containing protein [Myxococcales bacterium]|nr:SurA N-terminal domain-containing protein [Myxococcales bacterium]MDH5306333.1 SurA N-terminal domain-containing protein [Myxococcales bacterium]MDH5565618.1 SurA N-terminal domain-containing protein [Myxococcales bacterium]
MPRRILLAGLCLPLLAAAPSAGGPELVDGIAAQVGNSIVLVSEVTHFVAPQEAAMRSAGASESDIAKLRAQGLEHLIESRMIEDLVRQAELYATDQEIDRTIASIAKENGLSPEQLEASVAFYGMSFEQYRAQIKRDLERRNVVNAMLGSKIEVDEADVRRLYEQRFADQPKGGEAVHVRQLLITYGGASGRDQASACGLVQAAHTRITDGESFAEIAQAVSEVAPQDGGDIGWLHLDSVADWMRDALAPLEPGATSDVLVLPFGCTLLNLVQRREFAPVSFEQVQDALTQELWEQRLETAYREWIEELRGKTYIDRRGYFADAARFGQSTFPVPPGGQAGLQ